jgi:hypothetical protein
MILRAYENGMNIVHPVDSSVVIIHKWNSQTRNVLRLIKIYISPTTRELVTGNSRDSYVLVEIVYRKISREISG